MRRECNRSAYVLPFCYKFIKTTTHQNLNSTEFVNKTQLNNNSEQSTHNKNNTIESNPYYAKYSHKIEKLKQENGSINNRNDRKESNNEFKLNDNQINENIDKTENFCANNQNKKRFNSDFKSNDCHKSSVHSLDRIVKLDLLRDKSAEEITNIWSSYHKSKDCIYAVIPGNTYDKMFSMAQKYPTFIFPIPRLNKRENNENAYEFILSQFNGHKCSFTPLASYQSHKERAETCLTISHFPELQRDKGIVLMFGQYDQNILNCFESQCLANQLQWYYGGKDNMKQTILLHTFNNEPNLFNYLDLIKELEEGILRMNNSSNNYNK